MASQELWARVKSLGTHGLRRGAWYRVVNRSKPELLIVDVAKRNVPVPRASVDLSEVRPAAWSIVVWNERDPGIQRVSSAGFALTYAVCPTCRGRVELPAAEPASMACPSCGGEYGFDREHPC
jgi:hypothetical protein